MLFPSTRLSQSWTAGHIRNLEERLKEPTYYVRKERVVSPLIYTYGQSWISFSRERVSVEHIERFFYQQKRITFCGWLSGERRKLIHKCIEPHFHIGCKKCIPRHILSFDCSVKPVQLSAASEPMTIAPPAQRIVFTRFEWCHM